MKKSFVLLFLLCAKQQNSENAKKSNNLTTYNGFLPHFVALNPSKNKTHEFYRPFQ